MTALQNNSKRGTSPSSRIVDNNNSKKPPSEYYDSQKTLETRNGGNRRRVLFQWDKNNVTERKSSSQKLEPGDNGSLDSSILSRGALATIRYLERLNHRKTLEKRRAISEAIIQETYSTDGTVTTVNSQAFERCCEPSEWICTWIAEEMVETTHELVESWTETFDFSGIVPLIAEITDGIRNSGKEGCYMVCCGSEDASCVPDCISINNSSTERRNGGSSGSDDIRDEQSSEQEYHNRQQRRRRAAAKQQRKQYYRKPAGGVKDHREQQELHHYVDRRPVGVKDFYRQQSSSIRVSTRTPRE